MADSHPALLLASASPRRRQLLGYLGLPFSTTANNGEERTDQVPAAILERLPPYPLDHAGHPCLLAWRKASTAREGGATATILGADTIVVIENSILGKPRDADHAFQLLRRLSGRRHSVYTGLAVLPALSQSDQQPIFELVQASVQLAGLSDADIRAYIATGEPMDKAGAYGIQGLGGRLVEHVEGSFTAVVGLPLAATVNALAQVGLVSPVSAAAAWEQWRQTLAKEGMCINPSMF